MVPLSSWTCDTCGELITDPQRGLVVWKAGPDQADTDYKIVHKTFRDEAHPASCDPGSERGYNANLPLNVFLGPDGLAMLLSWLSPGPLIGPGSRPKMADLDEYVDLVRRVQTPWYEEARSHFDDEQTRSWLADANEYYSYLPSTLKRTAEGKLGR